MISHKCFGVKQCGIIYAKHIGGVKMLKQIDTFDAIVQLREKLINGNSDVLECWKEYASQYYDIKEQCLTDSEDYDFDKMIKPVLLDALVSNFNKVEIAHDNFVKAIDKLGEKFYSTFSIDEDIYILFYIGLCNGAGWATHIDAHQAVFIGAEKVAELNWHDEKWMISLLYHELSHSAHSILRNQPLDIQFNTRSEKSIWQLYIEGFAQRYEQILYGEEFYHQDKNSWLKWCQDNHSDICREYLYRIKNNISTQCFFGDWVNYKGYSDVGYYLGCEFIKDISDNYSTKELANIKMNELEVLITNYLDKF